MSLSREIAQHPERFEAAVRSLARESLRFSSERDNFDNLVRKQILRPLHRAGYLSATLAEMRRASRAYFADEKKRGGVGALPAAKFCTT